MKGLSISVAAALLVLAGCSGNESDRAGSSSPSPSPSVSASTSPSPSPSPTPPALPELGNDPKARKELTQAILALLGDNTGTYQLDVVMTGAGFQERASFQIQPRAFEIRRYLSSPEGTYTFDFRAVGPSAWMRAIDKPGAEPRSWPCWVDVADLASGAPPELSGLMTSEIARTQPPNAVIAASYGIGREYTDLDSLGSILGTLDLVTAMSLMGSQAILKTGLDPASKATVPAYFDVQNGRLNGYTVGLRGLFLALQAEGVDLPADSGDTVSGSIEVTFADQGTPVSVTPPDPDEVVDIPPGTDNFADEMAACGARQG
jgi:hypothetical protein